MYEALRKGASVETLSAKTHIKKYFIEQMKDLVGLEERILQYKKKKMPDELLAQAKKDGFADKYLAQILGKEEEAIRKQRQALGVTEAWEAVPVSGVENAAYYFSTYNAPDQVPTSQKPKVMVLGGGPNRIGQGIELGRRRWLGRGKTHGFGKFVRRPEGGAGQQHGSKRLQGGTDRGRCVDARETQFARAWTP